MVRQSALRFYTEQGAWSDPKDLSHAFDDIEASVAEVALSVQGLFVHDHFGACLYQEPPKEIGTASRATLPISERLRSLHGINEITLVEAREPKRRRVVTCRDFALLTCAILRHHGIPARVRCGFARYFHPPTYEDHWICQFWSEKTGSWKMVDAQLDEAHIEHLDITFDIADIPEGEFLFPWAVWEEHRNNLAALESFGHGEAKGFWFVRVGLARDFLALTKNEVSSWDTWREQTDGDKAASDDALAECDQLAQAAQYLDTNCQIDPAKFEQLATSIRRPHWRA